MTDTLIAALAVTLTVADGVIRGLGRQLAGRDEHLGLLMRRSAVESGSRCAPGRI